MKLKLHSEIIYVVAIFILSFAVSMMASADFGLSMVAAPAYILWAKFPGLTYGQWEYVFQGIVFIIFCLVVRRFRVSFLSSFLTCLLYGLALDMWRLIIPMFNPSITEPGSMALWLRHIFFVLGEVLTAISVALFFKTYLYPQVIDFSVKGISERYNLNRNKFKIIVDIFFLVVSVCLTLCLFKKFVGIGIATFVIAFTNGLLISLFVKVYDKLFNIVPIFPKFADYFKVKKDENKKNQDENIE